MRRSTLQHLAVTLVALAATAAPVAAASDPPHPRGEEPAVSRRRHRSPPAAPSAVARAATPGGLRLRGVPSPAERVAAMDVAAAADLSDFLERLRALERQRDDALRRRSDGGPAGASSLLFWSLTGGALLVLLSSHGGGGLLSSPSVLPWKDVGSALCGAYWLVGVRPGMSLGDMLTPLSALVIDGNAREHLVSTLLPQGLRTLKRIVVAELWSAYFRRLWRELEALWEGAGSGELYEESIDATTSTADDEAVLVWLRRQQQLFWEILERGTKKVIQSSLQKKLQAAFGSVASFVLDTVRQASSRGAVEIMGADILSSQ